MKINGHGGASRKERPHAASGPISSALRAPSNAARTVIDGARPWHQRVSTIRSANVAPALRPETRYIPAGSEEQSIIINRPVPSVA